MNLKDALGVLSRSSKYSVSTLRTENTVDDLQKLKDYLYIIPEIQKDFELALGQAKASTIFCLCGSSGDGKSEILTKLYKRFSSTIDFHLDATHSKSQHKSAIDCLNERFDQFKVSNKPLAIGINIGMLQKFIKQGSERHKDIKKTFEKYFENRHVKGFEFENISFYDFECYPRLEFSSNGISSTFVSSFLKRLTDDSPDNPFYDIYQLEDATTSYVAKNFRALSIVSLQEKLVELFGLARLVDEQFLIPRIFVDYIYQIITRKNDDGIVGNIFNLFDSEYSRSFIKFDPVGFRSNELDNFYLEWATQNASEALQIDIDKMCKLTGFTLTPQGIIRSGYLLEGEGIKSSLATFFKKSIIQKSLENYLKLLSIYHKSAISNEDEDTYLSIIEELVVNSALEYANRLLPLKVEGYIVSRKLDKISVCNKISIQADLGWVEDHQLLSTDFIPIPLLINTEDVYTFNLDLNTMIQAILISNGFRPNRQNLESVAKFDELILHIVDRTVATDSMKLVGQNEVRSISKNRNRYTVEV